jgi:hypothetical protein
MRIITKIVERNKNEIAQTGSELLSIKDLRELLFFRWDPSWIEINLSKSLVRCINSSAYTFYVKTPDFEQEILDLIEKYERKTFKERVLTDEKIFENIIEIISKSMKISKIEACLRLFQDCLIQREDFRNGEDKAMQGELYRDGVEVMEFLFDVLNYIAGYHESQIKIQDLTSLDEKMTIYPHVVLALESVQNFFEMACSEKRPVDYLHRIMLRLYVITLYLYNIIEQFRLP